MSEWTGLGVCNDVLQALSELGFTQPTAIQSLAIPPAILHHRDIIGAAETVSRCSTICQSNANTANHSSTNPSITMLINYSNPSIRHLTTLYCNQLKNRPTSFQN